MTKKYSTNKLTDSVIRAAKPNSKLYPLPDGGNLHLIVYPTGSKSWRYNYRLNGKSKTYQIGKYPQVSLTEAREARRWALAQISEGKDPALIKKIEKSTIDAETFEAVARDWLEVSRINWSESHADRTDSYLKRDVYPVIGQMGLKAIETKHVILIIRKVAGRGAVDAAKRLKGVIAQVFDYGVVNQLCDANPARQFETKALNLPDTLTQHYAAIKDPFMFGGLLRDIDSYRGGVSVAYALRLAPYVALRPSELSEAEWTEINFDEKKWVLPARRRKLPQVRKRANRAVDDFVIPLSKQAIAILEDLKQYTGRGKLLFPSNRGSERKLSENALRVGLRTLGYSNDDHTPHGFRGSFSTMMNELEPQSKTMINAAIAHKISNEVEAAYNSAQYIEERRRILQKWADYIDGLRAGADVIQFSSKQA